MNLLLLLLFRYSRRIGLCQLSADGTGLLCSEIEWCVLLLGVVGAESGALVGVDHSEDSGDGFAEVMSMGDGMLVFGRREEKF